MQISGVIWQFSRARGLWQDGQSGIHQNIKTVARPVAGNYMITRREIFPSLVAVSTTGLAHAQTTTFRKKIETECENEKCECEGKPGPKGDKGDKGDPGICECKHESRSLHVDFEIFPNIMNGIPLPLPDIIVNTPNAGNTGLMDELWYYKRWNACVFFDYSKPISEYIIFWREGEIANWDMISPIGMRVWNWIARNPDNTAAHACIVSLDRILSKSSRIIQDWTPITNSITFGSF